MKEAFAQKTASAKEWRQIPWSTRIGTASISSSAWTSSPSGLNFTESAIVGLYTRAVIDGPVGLYRVKNTVVTTSGETIPYEFALLIEP